MDWATFGLLFTCGWLRFAENKSGNPGERKEGSGGGREGSAFGRCAAAWSTLIRLIENASVPAATDIGDAPTQNLLCARLIK